MLLDGVPIAVASRLPEIDDRPLEPGRSSVCETEARSGRNPFSASPTREQLVAHRASGGNAAVDRAPPLPPPPSLKPTS